MKSLLAPRIERIKPSPSSMAVRRVRELKASGVDIVGLTTGEPDFDTPEWVKEAARRAMAEGKTKYTNVDGTPELKRAVQAKFVRENGLEYSLDEIVVSSGGKQVIFNALLTTIAAGDEAVIPVPCWVSYPDIVLLAGGTPRLVPCPPERGFKLTPAELERALTPRTKWLILNSPCNPSGAAYSAEELRGLAELLLRHPQVHVLTDDIYEHILYDGRTFATLAQVAPEMKARTLTVNGVSKAYAMTGWRIGYAGGPARLIKAMVKLQSQSTSGPCSISQAAAREALSGPQEIVRERTALFQERRDAVVALLNTVPGLACHLPEGAFYAYPSCAGILGRTTPTGAVLRSDADVVMYLLEAQRVATLQGDAYGLSPYFRISFAASMDTLREGCRRIRDACATLK
jgi:aspartate aminotransferase